MSAVGDELQRVADQLARILGPRGFEFGLDDAGVSSGGQFATGFFVRASIRMGLIVRRFGLGCPNYVYKNTFAGHVELISVLDKNKTSHAHFDKTRMVLESRAGGNVIDALIADLTETVLPALDASEEEFGKAILVAHARYMERLRSPYPPFPR
jgi:hypothetical protein